MTFDRGKSENTMDRHRVTMTEFGELELPTRWTWPDLFAFYAGCHPDLREVPQRFARRTRAGQATRFKAALFKSDASVSTQVPLRDMVRAMEQHGYQPADALDLVCFENRRPNHEARLILAPGSARAVQRVHSGVTENPSVFGAQARQLYLAPTVLEVTADWHVLGVCDLPR